MKKLASLLLALLLLTPCALAEDAAENPFVGTWQALYMVMNGEATVFDSTPVYVSFDEQFCYTSTDGFGDEGFSPAYTWSGNTLTTDDYANGSSITFTLESEKVLVMRQEDATFLLIRVDDAAIMRSRFEGDWQIILSTAETGMQPQAIHFGELIATFSHMNLACPCVYTAAGCTLTMPEGDARCTIDASGMMTIALPSGERLYLVTRVF